MYLLLEIPIAHLYYLNINFQKGLTVILRGNWLTVRSYDCDVIAVNLLSIQHFFQRDGAIVNVHFEQVAVAHQQQIVHVEIALVRSRVWSSWYDDALGKTCWENWIVAFDLDNIYVFCWEMQGSIIGGTPSHRGPASGANFLGQKTK